MRHAEFSVDPDDLRPWDPAEQDVGRGVRAAATPHWRTVGLSACAALAFHLSWGWGVRPAWHHHVQTERQRQAEQQAEQRLEQRKARELALQQEDAQRLAVWRRHQAQAWAPWQSWLALIEEGQRSPDPVYIPQWRWADGIWTLQGLIGHEAALHHLAGHFLTSGRWQISEAAATLWPTGTDSGWPAWRFQLRWQSGSSLPAVEGPP